MGLARWLTFGLFHDRLHDRLERGDWFDDVYQGIAVVAVLTFVIEWALRTAEALITAVSPRSRPSENALSACAGVFAVGPGPSRIGS